MISIISFIDTQLLIGNCSIHKENSPIGEPARRRQRRSCTYTVFLKIATASNFSSVAILYFLNSAKKESVYIDTLFQPSIYYMSQRKINIVPKIVTKAMNIIKYTLP